MSCLKWAMWFMALGLLVSSSAVPLANYAATADQCAEIDRFAGLYTLVRDQSDDPKQAIERVVGGMNFFLRTMARRQLRQKAVVYDCISLQRKGEFFDTTVPAKAALSLPMSGSTVLWKAPDGEVVNVRLQLGSALVQVFENKQGRRENSFSLSSDQRLLTVEVTFTSRELPEPVQYRIVYRRS